MVASTGRTSLLIFTVLAGSHVAEAWLSHHSIRSTGVGLSSTATSEEETFMTVDESGARSVFGTKDYWDDVYAGRGDFPADCYSWYYDWGVLGKHVKTYLPERSQRILVPGVGNDSILLDLIQSGYTNLVGQDYSEHAVERQEDLLWNVDTSTVDLVQGDVTNLEESWSNSFDAVLEKGLLDAVYLSGDGNVERAVSELLRILKPGGTLVSVSGVIPVELRRELFHHMEWLRDGTADLQAGCFVLRKPE
jgi:SAM-dependent methyltransferase